MVKRIVSSRKKKHVRTKADVRTKRLNKKNKRYQKKKVSGKSKTSKRRVKSVYASRGVLGKEGIMDMFMSPIQWPVKDPTSSFKGELVSPDKRRDSVKYKWEEKQCEIVDISEIADRDTKPGVPNIVTVLPLSTHDYWSNLSTEYKYLKNMIVQRDEGEDEIKRTINPYANYNWVMEHYLDHIGLNKDEWNITGSLLDSVRVVPKSLHKGVVLLGATSVPNIHFDAYEKTNRDVLNYNNKYYNNRNFTNHEWLDQRKKDESDDLSNLIFLNVWVLFDVEEGSDTITNYNLSFGDGNGIPPHHVIRKKQAGDTSPCVYYLRPLKKPYSRLYTKTNMKVGEAYVFDSRYTHHASCVYPNAPSDSLRGSAEFRFIIAPK
jgi:hypothetical protein